MNRNSSQLSGFSVRLLSALFIAIAASGCVTQSIIDTTKFQKPATVAIVDIPKMRTQALITLIVPTLPGYNFTSRTDHHFELNGAEQNGAPKVGNYAQSISEATTQQIASSPQPVSVNTGAAAGAVGGLMGALIQASAEETQKRAMGFQAELLKRYPDFDLAKDFMGELQKALAEKGIKTKVIGSERPAAPRMRWAATDVEGKPFPDVKTPDAPAVDADLLLQISPVALYVAPGPLNAYSRYAFVAVALFNGRTKAFLGMQVFKFDAPFGDYEYSTYNGLLEDLDRAAPALRNALLSLIPQVANIVSGESQASRK